ncbi:MAG TPA: hypothetical protein VLA77_03120 [Candidatus Saccharimonadales bacterium]|nr:hypothetical protein [Candidatus Saccharimonadales bacterium]
MSERGGYDPNVAGTVPWYSKEQRTANSIDTMPHPMMVEIAGYTQAARESGVQLDEKDVAEAIAQAIANSYGDVWRGPAFELGMILLRQNEQ